MMLGLGVEAFTCAVFEGHVLQLALAACIADGAVEGMVAEEQFDGGFARLGDFGDSVMKTWPSATVVVQAVCSLGTFSWRTTHMRQAAWRLRPG